MTEDALNAVRSSVDVDHQAINELRNFIQNSGKKGESFCSIKVTGMNDRKASKTKMQSYQ